MLAEPVKPYAGSSGHTRPVTSKLRADEMDESGSTANWQERLLEALQAAGPRGLASWEFKDMYPANTSTAQSTVSTMYKPDMIKRLTSIRSHPSDGRFGYVHVLPEFVNGRDTIPYEPQKKHLHTAEGIDRAEKLAQFLARRAAGTMTEKEAKMMAHKPQPGDAEVAAALVYLLSFSKPKEGKLKAREKKPMAIKPLTHRPRGAQ